MTYEQTPVKEPSKTAIIKQADKVMDQFTTGRILWHLTKRHKFGLVTVWAIGMTTLYVFPFLPGLLAHM